MYISHKSNAIQTVHETEWECRRKVKGLNKSEYWTWLDSVTSGDPPVVDYSGETGYTIVECTDENVQARLIQLGDYQAEGVYNITWSDDKKDSEIVDVPAHTIAAHKDEDGNDVAEKDVATTYVQTHFVGDDTAKAAWELAEEWKEIRKQRTRLLAETDWVVIKARENGGTVPAAWKTYRVALRDVPSEQSSKTKYSEITWPTKPS